MAPHEILGISLSADRETIKRAYRQKARQHHPDRGGDAKQFIDIRRAYDEMLSIQCSSGSIPPRQSAKDVDRPDGNPRSRATSTSNETNAASAGPGRQRTHRVSIVKWGVALLLASVATFFIALNSVDPDWTLSASAKVGNHGTSPSGGWGLKESSGIGRPLKDKDLRGWMPSTSADAAMRKNRDLWG